MAKVEICEDCGRPKAMFITELLAGENVCPYDSSRLGRAYCERDKLRSEVATLKAKLEAARKVVEAAKGMRATVPVHSGGDCVDTEPFDAALAELEKLK